MNEYLDKVRSLDNEKLIRYLAWCSRYHSVPLPIITEPPVWDKKDFEIAVKTVKEIIRGAKDGKIYN